MHIYWIKLRRLGLEEPFNESLSFYLDFVIFCRFQTTAVAVMGFEFACSDSPLKTLAFRRSLFGFGCHRFTSATSSYWLSQDHRSQAFTLQASADSSSPHHYRNDYSCDYIIRVSVRDCVSWGLWLTYWDFGCCCFFSWLCLMSSLLF